MSRLDETPKDPLSRGARWTAGLLAAALAILFVVQGARIAALPAPKMVSWNVVIDDGYYYLQVARNLARGYGSTFDRVNPTNGYQPLWALALAPIYLFTHDAIAGLRAALVLAALLGGVSIFLLYLAASRLAGAGGALLFATLLVANPYFLQILQGGLETPVLFLCLAAIAAHLALRGQVLLEGARRPLLVLGALLGATILARVDVLIILAPFALILALAPRPAAEPAPASVPAPASGLRPYLRLAARRALLLGLPAAALVGPYVLFNLVTQRSIVPTSGLVKRWVAATHTPTRDLFLATEQWRGITRTIGLLSWPRSIDEPDYEKFPKKLEGPVLLVGFLALRLLYRRRARRSLVATVLLGGMLLGAAVHALYLFYVYRSLGHWNYHYLFPHALLYTALVTLSAPLLASDLAALAAHLSRGRLARLVVPLGVALCLLPSGWLLLKGARAHKERYKSLLRPPEESFRLSRFEAAEVMRRTYGPDKVFGAWWAGTLGYLSDRRVVNLDGVINSYRFFRTYLATDTVDRYILEGPITHLVDFFWRDPLDPRTPPAWRAFFWEHDKEHIVKRLGKRVKLARYLPFRPPSGIYILEVEKKKKSTADSR
jgi:hypothetical protein